MKFAETLKETEKAKQEKEEEEDEENEDLLCADFNLLEEELKQIEEEVEAEVDPNNLDKASYAIPATDEGYLKVLRERFGHEQFKEGQLEAIKILLEEKKNTLVVLATGGGKSLVYQFVTQFLPGLILVVTPLIALMTD